MSSRGPGGGCGVIVANGLWFLSCLPGLIAFRLACRNVKRAQTRILFRFLARNARTELGQRLRFAAIRSVEDFKALPLTEHEDYVAAIERIAAGRAACLTADPVEVLLPTSGSTQGTKLIPCTRSLRNEIRAAVDPWIGALYLAYPSLLAGRQYWSLSPTTPCRNAPGSRVPTGFPDDAEYLGPLQRRLARRLFAVPPALSRVADRDAFEYLTLLFLLRESNLRLISVWHPSFLTTLVQRIPGQLPAIVKGVAAGTIGPEVVPDPDLRRRLCAELAPDPRRAAFLGGLDVSRRDFPGRIWPRLRVISCWTEGWSGPWLGELAAAFPGVAIQGKGLTATEGIVSFPLGRTGRKPCAVRSHFHEFIDTENGAVRNAWELQAGKTYAVVLTTGGGLCRYRLHDLVSVTGFIHQAPCLAFLSRDNLTSDLVGEKLNGRHVEESIRAVERQLGLRFAFAMLAPALPEAGDLPGYVLYAQADNAQAVDWARVAASLENLLHENYHYRHARCISQLQALRVFCVEGNATEAYRAFLIRQGLKAGDIKFTALSGHSAWMSVFAGRAQQQPAAPREGEHGRS